MLRLLNNGKKHVMFSIEEEKKQTNQIHMYGDNKTKLHLLIEGRRTKNGW